MPDTVITVQKNLANFSETGGDYPEWFFCLICEKNLIFPKYYWGKNIQKKKIYQFAENRKYAQGNICENIYS